MDRLIPWMGIVLALSTIHANAATRPDPELVAELDNANTTTLQYPSGTLPPEHARATSRPESQLRYSYRPTPSEKNFSFVIPSVVVHGFPIDKSVADQMPRKLDDGQTVVTPGAGLEYVTPGGFLVIGGILKDCYNDLAGLFQVGQQFKIASRTTLGYSLGVYMRETPIACTTTSGRFGQQTTCDEFDSYNLKWTTYVNGEPVDIIPMPFIHFTTSLYHDRNFEIDFKILSNFALNEFGFAIPF